MNKIKDMTSEQKREYNRKRKAKWRHVKTKEQRKLEKTEKKQLEKQSFEQVGDASTPNQLEFDLYTSNASKVSQYTLDWLHEKRNAMSTLLTGNEYVRYSLIFAEVKRDILRLENMGITDLPKFMHELAIKNIMESWLKNETWTQFDDFWNEVLYHTVEVFEILRGESNE